MPYIVVLIVAALLFIGLRLWLSQRRQEEAQKTVRDAIQRGVQLTPELIHELGVRPPRSDLYKGMIYLSVAISTALFGVFDGLEEGDESSVLTFLAVALFPALVGLVLIVFHFADRRNR